MKDVHLAVRWGHSWMKSFTDASIDAPTNGRIRRFLASTRLGLWPAIALGSSAFGYLLRYDLAGTGIVSANLCLIASMGFLFNDALDHTIDTANNVDRWFLQTGLDIRLFVAAIMLFVMTAALSYPYLSETAFTSLIVVACIVVAYSIFLKRVLLLGNLVAAGLSITPGLVMLVDVSLNHRSTDENAIEATIVFLAIGFLFLVSREIRFDEFDMVGDRLGSRLTLPMIFHRNALSALHAVLGSSALSVLIFVIASRGVHSTAINLTIALTTSLVVAVLMLFSYRSNSKTTFYKISRLCMLVVPISIFASF